MCQSISGRSAAIQQEDIGANFGNLRVESLVAVASCSRHAFPGLSAITIEKRAEDRVIVGVRIDAVLDGIDADNAR